MFRLFLAAGVAALAIAAPASAQKGEKGGGGGGQQSAKSERGGGGQAKPQRMERRGGGGGSDVRAQRTERRGGAQRMASAERGGKDRSEARVERRQERAQVRDRGERQTARVERGARSERQAQGNQRMANRVERNDQRIDGGLYRSDGGAEQRSASRRGNRVNARYSEYGLASALVNGCPPGLAMKDNGCMPPGQYKKQFMGQVLPAGYRDNALPYALRNLYRDDAETYYRYGDGYLYQVDRSSNLVSSLLPLLGGGYTVGQMFPSSYMNSYVPNQYSSFYPDSNEDYYRYSNGYVYEVDRNSGYIDNVIPMYDQGYGVGQMLPAGYDYYNVPTQYRDYYADSNDHYYRYAPGAIYQVDRGSNLITTVASLLTGGMSVGQRLPMGYDAYNVPYAYRDQYQDSPENMYRYSNGTIYQVDPTTQLITAAINALV